MSRRKNIPRQLEDLFFGTLLNAIPDNLDLILLFELHLFDVFAQFRDFFGEVLLPNAWDVGTRHTSCGHQRGLPCSGRDQLYLSHPHGQGHR